MLPLKGTRAHVCMYEALESLALAHATKPAALSARVLGYDPIHHVKHMERYALCKRPLSSIRAGSLMSLMSLVG